MGEYFASYDYVPHWLLFLLLVLSTGAVQYVGIGLVRFVMRRGKKPVQQTDVASAPPALHVVHLEPKRISDEDLRERTEGLG